MKAYKFSILIATLVVSVINHVKKAFGLCAVFVVSLARGLNSIFGGKPMKTQRRRNVLAAVLGLAAFLLAGGGAEAVSIVVPNSLAATEGATNFGFPFNIAPSGLSSQRFQQIFAASEFASLSGPQSIAQIAFRPDADFGNAFSSTISNIQINLSTTSKAPDGLSTTFANNVGADDTVVFSGTLSLSSADTGPAAGPKDFDIFINLLAPFLYDRTAGNLLLDVRNFSGGSTTQFDAQFVSGDPISSVFTAASGSTVNDSSGTGNSNGLVAQFTMTPAPVPEPGTVFLLGSGLAGLAASGWRRRSKAKG